MSFIYFIVIYKNYVGWSIYWVTHKEWDNSVTERVTNNFILPFSHIHGSLQLYSVHFFYLKQISFLMVCMFHHISGTPWPICLKFWLGNSEMFLPWFWESNLNGSNVQGKKFPPPPINFVHGSHKYHIDIISHVTAAPRPLACPSRSARPPSRSTRPP